MFDLDALGWTVVRMKRPISSTNVPRTRTLQRQEGPEGPFRLPSAHSGPFPMLNLLDMTHCYCMLIIGDAV